MMQPVALEDVARRAVDGDRDALDRLVRDLQCDIYGLALRMLWNREDAEDATQEILVRAVTRLALGCTLGMLQCLDRPHRLTYLLGEILELPGPEAAEALEITPDLFRKRLQQARAAILSFTRTYCGLASDTAACACNRRVPAALRVGRIREDIFDFACRLVQSLDSHRNPQPRS